LKEQDAAYKDKFSHKTKIQSKDDSDFDSVSDEEGYENTLAHQILETMHLGLPPWAKRLLALAKSPQQAASQAACSQGEDTAGFRVYPVLERPDPINPNMQQRFHENIPFKTIKEAKQACAMYGSKAPFMLGLLQSVVGNTAMPPDNWTGLAKACLSPGGYLLWKTGFSELCQEQTNCNLVHGVHITGDMPMGRGPFEGIDNQLQYPPQAYQQIVITDRQTEGHSEN
jgi:hypothetical protein